MRNLQEEMQAWRRHLHMHPETAFEEVETAAFVAEKLREMGLEVCEGIGGTGVVATLKAGDGERVVCLRADMDALNLAEQGNPPYRSHCPGKMHGCGHDGHVAALLGAAKLLSERRDFRGTVRFLFQPAEEPGKGARAMLRDGLLERFPIDEIYGIHNLPALPAGTFHTRTGGFFACEDNFTIVIHGSGGHASAPHNVIDPLVIAAEIILALQTIVSRNADIADPAVVSCTELHTDGAHNAIPSTVTILGDARSYTRKTGELIETRMREICEGICRTHRATCEFRYTHEFAATSNWKEQTAYAAAAAAAVVGADRVDAACAPFMSSEDFGVFLEQVPGCFLVLGTGTPDGPNAPLHNSRFDYNDEMLLTGAEFFAELVRRRLPE